MKKQKQTLKKLLLNALILVIVTLNVSALVNVIEVETKQFAYWLMKDFEASNLTLNVPSAKAVEKVYKYNDKISVDVVKAEIIKQAKIYGNDVQFMLDLADCESDFNNLAENDKSSAEGIFQYLYSTWRETDSGKQHISRFDYKANIKEANLDIANHEYFRWEECLQ